MIVTEKYGVYHATNEGFFSWAEFAEEIFRLTGKGIFVRYVETKDYPTKAVRPLNSKIGKKSLDRKGFQRLETWEKALERYIEELSSCTWNSFQ